MTGTDGANLVESEAGRRCEPGKQQLVFDRAFSPAQRVIHEITIDDRGRIRVKIWKAPVVADLDETDDRG